MCNTMCNSGAHVKATVAEKNAQSQSSQDSKVLVGMDQPDVSQEREKVTELQLEPNANYPIISDDMKKIYPGKDGNPPKFAVKGLSLVLPPGECFGMLGPNDVGQTSFISMMIGFLPPTSGIAYVHGTDVRTDMDKIYTSMGVCPQHDLLWETRTGREHLLFYGRLKNLKGSALTQFQSPELSAVPSTLSLVLVTLLFSCFVGTVPPPKSCTEKM